MGVHWTDKGNAVALVGEELARRGWKLYGYRGDESDSMTDYYSPAHWYGVASKGDVVACVNVSGYTVKNDSGKLPEIFGQRMVETCDRCEGKKTDPEGWTIARARENPAEFHRQHLEGTGARSLLNVISPHGFIDGVERCRKCGGSGGRFEGTRTPSPESERWPTFQANPRGCSWHVEREGKIVAHGSGVYSCLDRNDRAGQTAAVKALVDRIEREAAGSPMPDRITVDQVTVRPGKRPGFVDVIFPGKPAATTISALKRAGFRWAPSFGCWYGLETELPEAWRLAP